MAEGPPQFDWKKLWAPESRVKTIMGGIIAVLAVALAASLAPKSEPGTPNPLGAMLGGNAPPATKGNSGPVNSGYARDANGNSLLPDDTDGRDRPAHQYAAASEAVPLHPINQGQCRTLAPDGWNVIDTNPNGTVFTLATGDRSQIASYAGVAIDAQQVQGYYGPQYTSPEAFVQYAAGVLTGQQGAQLMPGPRFGAYQTGQIQAGAYRGYVLYYTFHLDADPGGFGMIMRFALAQGDPKAIGAAGSVSAATRCTAIVIPQPIGNTTDRGAAHGAGTSKDCAASGSCDDADLAGTYNAQLGTGWVHDSLGRNYNVDTTTDYDDNGPDGPGYYVMVGGHREKAQPGIE